MDRAVVCQCDSLSDEREFPQEPTISKWEAFEKPQPIVQGVALVRTVIPTVLLKLARTDPTLVSDLRLFFFAL